MNAGEAEVVRKGLAGQSALILTADDQVGLETFQNGPCDVYCRGELIQAESLTSRPVFVDDAGGYCL